MGGLGRRYNQCGRWACGSLPCDPTKKRGPRREHLGREGDISSSEDVILDSHRQVSPVNKTLAGKLSTSLCKSEAHQMRRTKGRTTHDIRQGMQNPLATRRDVRCSACSRPSRGMPRLRFKRSRGSKADDLYTESNGRFAFLPLQARVHESARARVQAARAGTIRITMPLHRPNLPCPVLASPPARGTTDATKPIRTLVQTCLHESHAMAVSLLCNGLPGGTLHITLPNLNRPHALRHLAMCGPRQPDATSKTLLLSAPHPFEQRCASKSLPPPATLRLALPELEPASRRAAESSHVAPWLFSARHSCPLPEPDAVFAEAPLLPSRWRPSAVGRSLATHYGNAVPTMRPPRLTEARSKRTNMSFRTGLSAKMLWRHPLLLHTSERTPAPPPSPSAAMLRQSSPVLPAF